VAVATFSAKERMRREGMRWTREREGERGEVYWGEANLAGYIQTRGLIGLQMPDARQF
jgi:hypothetical protein